MRRRTTPFKAWMDERGVELPQLAVTLRESESRLRSYAMGRAIPRPEMLRKLKAHTGLPSDAFLFPFEWKREAA